MDEGGVAPRGEGGWWWWCNSWFRVQKSRQPRTPAETFGGKGGLEDTTLVAPGVVSSSGIPRYQEPLCSTSIHCVAIVYVMTHLTVG